MRRYKNYARLRPYHYSLSARLNDLSRKDTYADHLRRPAHFMRVMWRLNTHYRRRRLA